jgi:hypothetical protein
VGSLLAAFWVITRKRTSIRSAGAVGALTVLIVLIASTTWIEYQAGLELEQVGIVAGGERGHAKPDAKRMFIVTQLHKLDGAPDMIELGAGADDRLQRLQRHGRSPRRLDLSLSPAEARQAAQALTTCKVRGRG